MPRDGRLSPEHEADGPCTKAGHGAEATGSCGDTTSGEDSVVAADGITTGARPAVPYATSAHCAEAAGSCRDAGREGSARAAGCVLRGCGEAGHGCPGRCGRDGHCGEPTGSCGDAGGEGSVCAAGGITMGHGEA